jgi:hypothetical protein
MRLYRISAAIRVLVVDQAAWGEIDIIQNKRREWVANSYACVRMDYSPSTSDRPHYWDPNYGDGARRTE